RISSILRTTVHASQEMSATLTRSSAKLVKIPDNPETTPKPHQSDAATLKNTMKNRHSTHFGGTIIDKSTPSGTPGVLENPH
ncbi:MAG: hypothetical protein ACK6D4_02990, partial [Planctomyces sp.]